MSLQQLLWRLRIDPDWADIDRCKRDLALSCWAESIGLTAPNADLQAAVTQFRRAHKLYTAAQASAWLEQRGMTLENLIEILKPQVLYALLATQVVTEDRIRQRFIETSYLYDSAEMYTIVTHDYGIAQELIFQLEDGADFHTLARLYSTDAATAKSGGYAGIVHRADLEPEIAAAVFKAEPGSVLGPFERRPEYCLICVENVTAPELNADLEVRIRETLFQEQLLAYQTTLNIRDYV